MANQFTYADLSYLESMSMGSSEMVQEMIQIFLDQLPEFTEGLSELLKKQDYPALGALAHKAKSSVAVMGMDHLAGILKELELKAKAAEDTEHYAGYVGEFLNQIRTTEEEMKAYLGAS